MTGTRSGLDGPSVQTFLSIIISYERPFIAGLYLLTTPFIGSNPTNWQIFALFTRWLAVLSLWWSLG